MIRLTRVGHGGSADRVHVFIHGLNGDPLETWGAAEARGAFIHRLAGALGGRAFTAEHPSSLAAYAFDPQQTIASVATGLAEAMAGVVSGAQRIDVIGHCFGGVLASQALVTLWRESPVGREWLARADLRVVFLDSPQLLPGNPSPWLARLLSVVGAEPAALRANVEWLLRERPSPCLALRSQEEPWIDDCAPFACAAPEDRATLALPHTALSRCPLEGAFAPLDLTANWLR
ncbi:alpha/beta fold hydrolase [Phenylobacterium sp.]|uniref:alpha/beta fold hydrolase n=1 Tax=Phenylobacterium sp. TaxID=1871053 RepID=UPI0037C762ED